jgi:hypothetical protein
MSTKRLPTWVSVLIAAVIIVGIVAVAAVGGAAFFIYRHVNTTFTPRDRAEVEFSESRARFDGQRPLIEVRHDDDPIIHRELLKEGAPKLKLDALRVLAYDQHANKLVRVSIPFWLLRMAPSKHLSFLNDNGFDVDVDSDRVRLTVEDLERRGPGLLLDTVDRRGSRVLVWTE